jgi:ABC-type Na+ efflux pump permease subunit
MRAIWTLARKEFRVLLRDRRSALILVAMPLLFILVLGLLLGETFGQKPDDRTRILVVDLDRGPGPEFLGGKTWAREVLDDMKDTAGIKVELIPSAEEALRLVEQHKQAAVVIFQPDFSQQINQCSFLTDGINPFHRDGVYLDVIHVLLKKDSKQPGQAAIIEQVAQTSLLRVILPYMIGKAFERLSEPAFINLLGQAVYLPVPKDFVAPLKLMKVDLKDGKVALNELLRTAAKGDPEVMEDYRQRVGAGVQAALAKQFENYQLTGKTWAKLTKSKIPRQAEGGQLAAYVDAGGSGLLRRGAHRYQLLVPSYTVMFAFFLVLTVGWLFVSERRQGTLKRLRAAPLTRGQILLGKLLPCFALALGQGACLLLAGKLFFGMRWGPDSWPLYQQVGWLGLVVVSTSLAAMGLALLIASVARTEMQVALYGAIPVLVLALIGGCVLPREMMPEETQRLTLIAPHGWALDAYRELLDPDPYYTPQRDLVLRSCGVLAAFGLGFVGLAWWFLRLE